MNESRVGSKRNKTRSLIAMAGSALLAGMAAANPPLTNRSFEIVGPNGSPTVHAPPAPGGAGPSAAESWGVFHNTAGGPNTTVTEIVTTTLPLSPGVRMIRVETDGANNGLSQTTGGPGTGPPNCIVSGWVFVNSGVVGMGGGNHGNTQPTSIVTTTTGAWEHLQVKNLDSPCNSIIFYSIGGGADFYVDDVDLKELQVNDVYHPVEYSNSFDEKAIAGGGNHNGLDPGQILYTEAKDIIGPPYPTDVVDFFPGIENGNEPDAQIDALANGCDGFFDDVASDADRLIVSIGSDPGPIVPIAAYYEDPTGATGVQFTHRDLNDGNQLGDIEDVDALELWRGKDALPLDDSNFFSIQGDASGVSIFSYITGVPTTYITRAQILAALVTLDFDAPVGDVDVDALMVKDTGQPGIWDSGDEILFSIRAAPATGWTGVEIIHSRFGGPASFLIHGGHAWDTSLVLATLFPVDVDDNEVDAIEAPEPGLAAGLLGGLGMLLGLDQLRRRRQG